MIREKVVSEMPRGARSMACGGVDNRNQSDLGPVSFRSLRGLGGDPPGRTVLSA